MPNIDINEAIKDVENTQYDKNWFISVQAHEKEKLEQESQAKMQMANLQDKLEARNKALVKLSQRMEVLRARLIRAYIVAAFGIGGAVASILLQVLK